MSEYWVSKKKYWCQYCEIYIADDVPSRSQHENGLRHKGNKDRFIRGLYKSRVKQQHESEEEKREMQRVEQAAQAAYARDLGAGHATSSSLSTAIVPASAPKPKAPRPKPADPYTNYTTAASLGISDPDVERLIEEAKARKSEGRAGEWVAVVPPPPPLPNESGATVATAEGVKSEHEAVVGEVRRRVEDYSDEDDTRRFKMRRKTASVGLGEIYDPGTIRVKPRVKRDTEGDSTTTIAAATTKQPAPSGPVLGGDVARGGVGPEVHDALPKATEMPSWAPREWKWAGEDQEDQNPAPLQAEDAPIDDKPNVEAMVEVSDKKLKDEDDHGAFLRADPGSNVKEEEPTEPEPLPADSSIGGLFRKRKVPVGSNRGRRKV